MKIDLSGKRGDETRIIASAKSNGLASTIVTQGLMPTATPSKMSLQELRGNYNTILRAQAIHYPVAYQFVKELGRGRQGRVFLSNKQGARGCITRPAIKIFDPGIYRSVEEYWTDMGRIASQISRLYEVHGPHLVSRHSYEEAYGIGYVEMEAIDGMDIRRLLDKEHVQIAKKNCTDKEWCRFTRTLFCIDGDNLSFRPGAVVHIMRRVLRGLERLHNANFLHCDIKPANVMIDRLGTVKIVDFGRAVIRGERLSFMLGAPMYLAPETHRREPIDTRSDLYSVGLIGLEMLVGGLPIRVEEMDEQRLLESKIDLAENISNILPLRIKKYRNLVRTIKRLIDPDPNVRYANAREAEEGSDSLKVVDRRFVQARSAIEYEREFADYLSKLVDERTDRIEISEPVD